ncbi:MULTISPECIES: DUF4062 domain-containing protein [Vibrio harveyi group]|uniref:DUF4062 domain-containing protein n=1 Tax=Vibrio harveyi group TaxID=717610 RepID=UPI0005EDFD14|nr:DUF4062 domain-containing protein [Vibrio campbellii]
MAKLRVFVSSTYYDLKHVRSYVSSFITKMGYEATLSEKGKIAYDPSIPLDESCYKDASSCDILVLIIGGRYGSATSETDSSQDSTGFYDRYESVTRKEYETASEHDIPTYILVEKSVMSEYETFKKNRDNTTINYAHVESVNIFHFLDDILNKGRNNPTFQFEQPQEIEAWLKNQWSGYFRTLLEKKTQSKQIASLSNQVAELNSINTSLQRYLEKVIESVAGESANKIIEQEHTNISNERLKLKLMEIKTFRQLIEHHGVSYEGAIEAYSNFNTLEETIEHIASLSDGLIATDIIEFWKENPDKIDSVNEIRRLLNKPELAFE